jgi:hypothetical protein
MDSETIQIECRATWDLILFQHIRKLIMTRLSVDDDMFGGSSLTESTGSQKENNL